MTATPTRPRDAAGPGTRAAALACILLATVLAGCSNPAAPEPAGTLVSGSLRFAAPSGGQRIGSDVRWSFLIQNMADTNSTAATLRVSVSYAPAGDGPVLRTVPIPPLAAGDAQVFRTTTPYRGLGDYRGTAELDTGGPAVARDILFFEDCGAC